MHANDNGDLDGLYSRQVIAERAKTLCGLLSPEQRCTLFNIVNDSIMLDYDQALIDITIQPVLERVARAEAKSGGEYNRQSLMPRAVQTALDWKSSVDMLFSSSDRER